MTFQDNVIKEYLKHVYFIAGTPCGGKSTIAKALGEKYGIQVYDIDACFPSHQQMSDVVHQPAMNRKFEDADEFFGRSVEDYKSWLQKNTREQLDFVLLNLIRLSAENPIICDCHLTLDEARQISTPERVAFMIKEPIGLVEEYCNRPDHQGFHDFIHSATNYELAKDTCNATLKSLNMSRYENIKKSEFFWLERDDERTVKETLMLLEKHFHIDK